MNLLHFFRRIQERVAARQLARISSQAQAALAIARKEADRMNHNFIGTEHLLLAIMRSGSGMAFTISEQMGMCSEAVRARVEKWIGFGSSGPIAKAVPYTPRVKKALALAGKEATALRHSYVGTQHLLLGLLRVDGVACRVLKEFKVDIEAVRRKAIDLTITGSKAEGDGRAVDENS